MAIELIGESKEMHFNFHRLKQTSMSWILTHRFEFVFVGIERYLPDTIDVASGGQQQRSTGCEC